MPVSSLTLIKSRRADTKVFLVAKFAHELAAGTVIVIVVSDLTILACYIVQNLEINMLVQLESGDNDHIIDVKDHTWSNSIIQSFPSLHAISE